MALVLRGFFLESPEARTVLGIRFGVGLMYLEEKKPSGAEPTLTNTLTIGIFYDDAPLRYFNRDSLFFQKILVQARLDYYYLTLLESSYMIRYSGKLSYRISNRLQVGCSVQILNTANELPQFSAWNAGFSLSYTF